MLPQLEAENQTGVYQTFASVIATHIMSCGRCRKRNVLQELERPLSVDIYFSLQSPAHFPI